MEGIKFSNEKGPTLEETISWATELHLGQKDRAGEDYILHPLRMKDSARLITEDERILATLHDTMEDCGVTDDILRDRGYSDDIIIGLNYLSKLSEEENNYDAFIERVCSGPILVRRVKLADLDDNSDLNRIDNPTPSDYKRTRKYLKAIKKIEATFL